MSQVEIFSDYVTDRAFHLAGVTRELKLVKEILANYPNGVNLPYSDLEGNQTYHYITPKVCFGLAVCQRSLYNDLVEAEQPMLAIDIIGGFK